MIFDLILTPLVLLLKAIFAVLPTASLSSLLTSVDTAATAIGQKLAPWNSFLPLSELLGILTLLLATWLPALLIYKVANWLWRHFPDIAGFGPGAG